MANQHPLYIAIQYRLGAAEGEGGNRRCSRAADSRQRLQCVKRVRDFPFMAAGDLFRGGMQIARPAVIAESAPMLQHRVFTRSCERIHIRKALDETLEIRNDRHDLGLLQHDFRQPDQIRVAAGLPGQVVATVMALPVDDAGGKTFHPGRVTGVKWPINRCGGTGSGVAELLAEHVEELAESRLGDGLALDHHGLAAAQLVGQAM
jgi:hypothetical protein